MEKFDIVVERKSDGNLCLLENACWNIKQETITLEEGQKLNTGNVEIDIYGAKVRGECFLNSGGKPLKVILQRMYEVERFEGFICHEGDGNFRFKGHED
ncbi:MAG: hypothetical protein RR646_02550 [Erysipelotrichaceae bacterium]|uniref:hypothetical protein n=1 Tax=Niameybacter sp. TaxID=2033640 RepID=UPI002FC5A51D